MCNIRYKQNFNNKNISFAGKIQARTRAMTLSLQTEVKSCKSYKGHCIDKQFSDGEYANKP